MAMNRIVLFLDYSAFLFQDYIPGVVYKIETRQYNERDISLYIQRPNCLGTSGKYLK